MQNNNDITGLNSVNFDQIKQELIELFKSPNPISIYLKFNKLKKSFSDFFINLSQKISFGFDLKEDDKTFIFGIYKNSGYDKVWMNFLENYLRESKNFDLLSYIYFVKILNKDKQYLAKGLLKMYKKEDENEIKAFLIKFNSKVSFSDIKNIFDKFQIGTMEFSINLREDFVEHFIEKIYLQLDSTQREIFLDNFILKINKNNLDFSDMTKVLNKVVSNYTYGDKILKIESTLRADYLKDIKISVDNLLKNYNSIRGNFYFNVSDILKELSLTERNYFWQYIKSYIIENYYSEIKYLFYSYSSNEFVDKETYSNLKGEIPIYSANISQEYEYNLTEQKEINDLKQIILELNDNIFSYFLLPVVYYNIGETVCISKKDLYKMKYLILYIFCSNYNEYKKVYMFFNQLEVFLNYEKKPQIIEKVKVSFSLITICIIFLILSYNFLPIALVFSLVVLFLINFVEIMYPNYYFRQKFNLGLKFFAMCFLVISSYFWIQNFDVLIKQTKDFGQSLEFLGKTTSKEFVNISGEYIKTSILDIKK